MMREAAHRPLAPARRKAELLRFARRAARRLSAQIDPTLGRQLPTFQLLPADPTGLRSGRTEGDVHAADVSDQQVAVAGVAPGIVARRIARGEVGLVGVGPGLEQYADDPDWRCWTAAISAVSPSLLARSTCAAAQHAVERLRQNRFARPAISASVALLVAKLGSAPLPSRKPT